MGWGLISFKDHSGCGDSNIFTARAPLTGSLALNPVFTARALRSPALAARAGSLAHELLTARALRSPRTRRASRGLTLDGLGGCWFFPPPTPPFFVSVDSARL